MGQMRFYAPMPDKLLPHAVDLAYVAGLEAIPWFSRNTLCDNVLTIDRVVSESGNLYIPWSIPGIGERVLSTCTLMEREAPYCLATELARGTLHRARALAAEMAAEDRVIPTPIDELFRQALRAFIAATSGSVTAQDSAFQRILAAPESFVFVLFCLFVFTRLLK